MESDFSPTTKRRAPGYWPARAAIAFVLTLLGASFAAADENDCVTILQDELGWSAEGFVSRGSGPERTIPLANLMGHWPGYEVRVRPIWDYVAGQIDSCHATFYVGTSPDTEVPKAFLDDFFRTKKQVAWIGFGTGKLDQALMVSAFHHRVGDLVSLDNATREAAGFFAMIAYKGSLFRSEISPDRPPSQPVRAVRYLPADEGAKDHVLAWQIHDKTSEEIPYFLRAGNKFLIGDVPFETYDMAENGRYFAFADLLFDILEVKPYRDFPIAMGRLEDIHGLYDRPLLESALAVLREEDVPINIAHIPLFADPMNSYGLGIIRQPRPATDVSEMRAFFVDIAKDPRNAILWHGVTHQLGDKPNPYNATSGVDFEFWNAVDDRPVPGDSPAWVLDRLATGLGVLEAYGPKPRFWETPHYTASALDNVVFGRVFPWVVGRVDYYASSFGESFTLAPVGREVAAAMPGVSQEVLDKVRATSFAGVDHASAGRVTQIFPYEIYRDVYGQRILPETLGYIASGADRPLEASDIDRSLSDARTDRVIRDVWGSYFFHPYLLTSKKDGGIGQFRGDGSELRRLVVGLKGLGYRFISLEYFERSLGSDLPLRSN